MRKITSLLALGVLAAVGSLGMKSQAATYNLLSAPYLTTGVTLSTLASTDVLLVGNLSFTGFSSTAATGITVFADTSIGGFPSDTGLRFAATSPTWTEFAGQSVDTSISFSVTTTDNTLLVDDVLQSSGFGVYNAFWNISETVAGNNILLNRVLTSPSFQQTVDSQIFTGTPQKILYINKDISLNGGTIVGGTVNGVTVAPSEAFISDVIQGFSTTTVPVPAAAWTGLSTLMGLGVMGLLRKRARA